MIIHFHVRRGASVFVFRRTYDVQVKKEKTKTKLPEQPWANYGEYVIACQHKHTWWNVFTGEIIHQKKSDNLGW